MKNLFFATTVVGTMVSTALAQEVSPSAVVYKEGAVEQSLSGKAGDPANGRLIVGSKGQGNCVACHEVADLKDVPFQGRIGPALDGAGERWSEAELRGIVANAKVLFEGTMMPSFYKTEGFIRPGKAYTGKAPDGPLDPLLSAQEIEDVVAYLSTLKE